MNTLLFLCTGNYYRSRFAEVVFNSLATKSKLPWTAQSRALRISGRNVGPISPHALKGLAERELELTGELRYPILATEADFQAAQHIVAVKEEEHLPLMKSLFPDWTEHIEYWKIHDIDRAEPADALPLLHSAVEELHGRLRDKISQDGA